MDGSRLKQATLVLGLGLAVLAPALHAGGQTTAPREKVPSGDQMGSRDVTGTVKQVSADGLVVVARESDGKSREWAFALDSSTRIGQSGRTVAASALKIGDPVAVTYVERSGKVIAQSVKLLPGAGSPAPGAATPGSRTTPR